MSSRVKLPLTPEEKSNLRQAKVKISDLQHCSVEEFIDMLNIPRHRADILKGLADFQSVPSIGYQLAEKLVYQLNIYSLTDIKDQDGADLFDQLEKRLGVWTDSCVEDQIRCVIHYANHPKSDKQWFDFTNERKAYRELNGHPHDRPIKAWYE
ncbi:helix-hairpin-helix domain-containing protein [Aquisalibacillus elongatus]|uniref:Pathogenicity locus Cdd1 protein n=1 Tax=Aquisalibacillus elongatus TaxID=485577 RepID=A0A3N5AZ86_9BACI|nr:helix-hairpin-helix domain-containing protein [Aquisalibacillus elongatus]RPF50263.1 pathogenicity locus Cdd1 protein [Aquisalibacillus elongatus]